MALPGEEKPIKPNLYFKDGSLKLNYLQSSKSPHMLSDLGVLKKEQGTITSKLV